jgi:hypothetical protein
VPDTLCAWHDATAGTAATAAPTVTAPPVKAVTAAAEATNLFSIHPPRDELYSGWAHMLGYRGHFSTKSRRYSTALGLLRQTRALYRTDQARQTRGLPMVDDRDAITIKEWRFAGTGLRHGEQFWAELARDNIATARRIARERAG